MLASPGIEGEQGRPESAERQFRISSRMVRYEVYSYAPGETIAAHRRRDTRISCFRFTPYAPLLVDPRTRTFRPVGNEHALRSDAQVITLNEILSHNAGNGHEDPKPNIVAYGLRDNHTNRN